MIIKSLINYTCIILNQKLLNKTSNMNIVQLLFLSSLFRNTIVLNAKYLLVQINDEELEKMKPGLRGSSLSKTDTHLDASKRAINQYRKSRIIGGNEIKPHSEPWLALLCDNNHLEAW